MPQMTSDMQALREYVTYDSGIQNKGDSTVLLEITHSNLQAKFMQIRLDMHVRTTPLAPPAPESPLPLHAPPRSAGC